MVPFSGYEMPVSYPSGIIKEHLHTRTAAGLFDVSHMGQLIVRPRSGRIADAARAIETLTPVDVLNLPDGRQRYAFFTNETGGILDDLMIANRGDHFFLVVNASRKDDDERHLRAALSGDCVIERLEERGLLALQGPAAESVLSRIAGEVSAMRFMDVRSVSLHGRPCLVSRSGYTGEDGFEISVAADDAVMLARKLLDDQAVALIGLGARDSLRLEAGLCLYGADIDATTTPAEAGLDWAIQKSRRRSGARAGGFPGADFILRNLSEGPSRRRVGLKPEGRAPVRGGAQLFRTEQEGTAIGSVTSGGFAPSIGAPIAMGYVPSGDAVADSILFADVRGKRLPVRVSALPFIKPGYKRN